MSRGLGALFHGSSAESSSLLRRDGRGKASPGLLLLGVALVAFAGGWLSGARFGMPGAGDADPGAGLKTGVGGPRAPGLIEVNTQPMANEAFIVALYEPDADAKGKARDLAEYLRLQGLPKVRPYEYPTAAGLRWVVAVYFDGEFEQQATRQKLLDLPTDVPDAVFVGLRLTQGWPKAYPIR